MNALEQLIKEHAMAQASGTFPQLNTGGKKVGGKTSGKKGR